MLEVVCVPCVKHASDGIQQHPRLLLFAVPDVYVVVGRKKALALERDLERDAPLGRRNVTLGSVRLATHAATHCSCTG